MDDPQPIDWPRRLRPLHPGGEPIAAQLMQRTRALAVASAILVAILAYIAAIFAGFGRPDLGGAIAGMVGLPILGLAWAGNVRLRRTVRHYLAATGGEMPDVNKPD